MSQVRSFTFVCRCSWFCGPQQLTCARTHTLHTLHTTHLHTANAQSSPLVKRKSQYLELDRQRCVCCYAEYTLSSYFYAVDESQSKSLSRSSSVGSQSPKISSLLRSSSGKKATAAAATAAAAAAAAPTREQIFPVVVIIADDAPARSRATPARLAARSPHTPHTLTRSATVSVA